MSEMITFDIRPGETLTMSVAEARLLIQAVREALWAVPRVKCSTCRCKLIPGDKCICCNEDRTEDTDCTLNLDTDQNFDAG